MKRIGDGPHWESHLRDAQAEDVQFLVDNGATFKDACERVGVVASTLRIRVKRGERGGRVSRA